MKNSLNVTCTYICVWCMHL